MHGIVLWMLIVGVPNGAMNRVEDADLKQLAGFMIGAYTSQEQAKADPTYFEVHLQIVTIWPERQDGVWLYVEQAMATALDKPYRQRVLQLFRRDDNTLMNKAYNLPGEPLKHAGAWKELQPLADLAPEKLIERKGCHLLLKKQADGSYAGATEGQGCPSELRGAVYSISELSISAEMIKSWDRGFDKDDKQVWGPPKGPYLYKKIREPKKGKVK